MCTSSSCFCWMWSWIYMYRTLGLCLKSGSASFKMRIRRVVTSHRCAIHRNSKETPIAYLKCTVLLVNLKTASRVHFAHFGMTERFAFYCCCVFFKDGALLTKHSNTTILYNYLKSKLDSAKENYKTIPVHLSQTPPCQELAPNCLYWSLQGLLTEASWPHLSYLADIALRHLVFFIYISMNVVLLWVA